MTAKKPQAKEGPAFKFDPRKLDAMFNELGNITRLLKDAEGKAERKLLLQKHRMGIHEVKKAIKEIKTPLKNLDTEEFKNVASEYAKLLTWERQRKIISVPDEYELNKMELDRLEESGAEHCQCINKTPTGLRCELGQKYVYKSYFDEDKGREVFITYNPITIAPEEQISPELEWKMRQGFMPETKDYNPPKTIVRRFILSESEWKRYFEPALD